MLTLHVYLAGFNSFPDYVIKSCQFLFPKAPDGALFETILDLPNPSQATIEIVRTLANSLINVPGS